MFVEFFLVLAFSIPGNGNVFHDPDDFQDKMLPNYGVAFENIGKLVSTSTYWHRTFVMSMPKPEEFQQQQGNGRRVLSQILKLDSQMDQLAKKATDLIDYANARLPQLPKGGETYDRRKRSAPLGFIGHPRKDVFGKATMEDVRKIANLANKVSTANVIITQELKKTTSNLHSYMKTTNERMENLTQLASKEQEKIEELERQFDVSHKAQVANMEWLVHTLAFMASRQTMMSEMDLYFTLMHSAITDLSQGILSDVLVSEKDFKAVFEELNKVKASMGDDFHFMITNPLQFHAGSCAMGFVNGSDLWITVKLPIGIMKPLHLFRVHSWSTPVYANSKHATRIQGLPEYMAINHGKTYVGFLTLDQLQTCSQGEIRSCPFMVPLRERYGPHCIDNLFRGVDKLIMDTCHFALEVNVIAPLLLPVGQGKVLFQNIRMVTIKCGKDKRTIHGCNSCLLTLPCNCIVKAHPFVVVTSSVGRCSGQGQTRHVAKHHMVNFAVLRTFEKEEDALLQELHAGSLFDSRFALSEKKFKALDRQIKQITDHGAVFTGKLKDLEKQASQIAKESDALASTMLATWTTSAFLQTGAGRSIAGMGSLLTVAFIALAVVYFLLIRSVRRNHRDCVYHRKQITVRLDNLRNQGVEMEKKKTVAQRKRRYAEDDDTFIKAVHQDSNFSLGAKRRNPVNYCTRESLDFSEIDG